MLPAIFGSSVAQINVLLGGIIASLLGVGKISLLYYSDRLMEFPLGTLRHRAGDRDACRTWRGRLPTIRTTNLPKRWTGR